jgi:hypothetical protein
MALNVEAEQIGGTLTINGETTACGSFAWDDSPCTDVMETHVERLRGVFSEQPLPFVR